MIISIEGNIGSGKSTFLSYLKSNNTKFVFVREPVDEWESVRDTESGKSIIEKFDGGPVGLQALSAASSEEEDTILDIYEPYLMQCGFIERTPKGRMATALAYEHLGIKKSQSKLI
jgi:Holliday junction resolvasome RuvABC ATP-dependent DNA helicase subunit